MILQQDRPKSLKEESSHAMTTIQPIEPNSLLSEQLATASPDLLRGMLSTFIQTLMSAEADAACGAGYGERSEQRVNQRNGYRHRDFDTRVGTIDVAVPKLGQGSYFPDWLLERRKRGRTGPDQCGGDLLPTRSLHPPDGEARRIPRCDKPFQVTGVDDGPRPGRSG